MIGTFVVENCVLFLCLGMLLHLSYYYFKHDHISYLYFDSSADVSYSTHFSIIIVTVYLYTIKFWIKIHSRKCSIVSYLKIFVFILLLTTYILFKIQSIIELLAYFARLVYLIPQYLPTCHINHTKF